VFIALFVSAFGVMTSAQLTREQLITRAGLDAIALGASSVYAQGNGSVRHVNLELSDSTFHSTVNGKTLRFVLYGRDQKNITFERSTIVNVSGILPRVGGKYQITLTSQGDNVVIS
jgi:hypothetical protein